MNPPTSTPQILNIEMNHPQTAYSLKLTTIDRIGGISCNICHITISYKKKFESHYLEHNKGNTSIVYTCVICKKEISNYTSFRGHCYNNHVLQEEIRCDQCNKVFRRQTAYKIHYETMHTFKCKQDSCNKTFSSKKELHLHQIIHTNNKLQPPFSCTHCSEQIPTLDACKSHISDHVTFLYSCPICNQEITKAEAYKHINIHFDEELTNDELIETEDDVEQDTGDTTIETVGGIYCTYCSELYPDKAKFDEHFSEQHPENKIMYTCNICKKNIGAYSFLVYHCYEHVSKGKFECELCDKSFPRISLLSFHMEAYHGNDENDKPLKCIGCNLKFAKEERLRNHMREKHDIWKLTCPMQGCEMEFQTPKELLMHQKQHKTSQKNCMKCELMFPSLISCLKHIEIHKKYLYSCSVCSREYSEKHRLLNHIPEHFETVLHLCNVCGKAYAKKCRLAAHTLTHAAVKKHICSHCGKGFDKMFPYKNHLNVHTGLKPYSCTECTKSFTSNANYKKHVARMHKSLNKDGKKTDVAKQKPLSKVIPKTSSANDSNILDENELVQKTYKNLDTNNGDIESGIESVCSEMDTNAYECDNDFTTEKWQTNEISSELRQNNPVENTTEYTNTSYSYYTTDVESGIESVSSEVENYVYAYDDQNMEPPYVQPSLVKPVYEIDPECGVIPCQADFINTMPVLDLPSDFGSDSPIHTVAPIDPFSREYGPDFVNSGPKSMHIVPEFSNINPEFVNTGSVFANSCPEFANTSSEFANNGSEFTNDALEYTDSEFVNTGSEFANTCPEFANTAPEFENNSSEFANPVPEFANTPTEFANNSPKFAIPVPQFASTAPEFGNYSPEFANTAPEFANTVPEFANTAPEFENSSPEFANTGPDFASTGPVFANIGTEFANTSPELVKTGPEFMNTGPEFVNTIMDTTASGEWIPLDDQILPHINLMLRNNYDNGPLSYTHSQDIHDPYEENIQKWEPIITKLYQEYGTDSNALLNTDLF